MLKDYYKILGVPQTASAEEIKKAYRALVLKWHPDAHPEADTTEQIKEINEAYSILSYPDSRARYDAEYQFYRYAYQGTGNTGATDAGDDYEIQNEKLKQDVARAQKAAEEYLRDLFASLKKDSFSAAKGALDAIKPWLLGAIIMTVIGWLILMLSPAMESNRIHEDIQETSLVMIEPPHVIPADWETYDKDGVFEISVPPTVELRKDEDAYSSLLKNLNLAQDEGIVIFQQKGLSRQEESARSQYCRIMIQLIQGDQGDFMTTTETEAFDYEWKLAFDEMVKENIGPSSKLIGNYTYKWKNINGANCIQIDYRRTGTNFDNAIPVAVRLVLFQNDDKMVRMVLSYREKEHELWKEDFEMVLNSFKWL